MADIRINSLPTTASASSSDDFLALDGATNGTRKLNAYSPTFGGNLTASGAATIGAGLTSNGDPGLQVNATSTIGRIIFSRTAGTLQSWQVGTTGNDATAIAFNIDDNTVGATRFKIAATTGLVTIGQNLTVSGTGTSSVAGSLTVNAGAVLVDGPALGGGAQVLRFNNTNTPNSNRWAFVQRSVAEGDLGLYDVNAAAFRFYLNAAGNFLLGTTTDSSNGKLQLATHTTSAGGIGFGNQMALYLTNPSDISLDALAGNPILRFRNTGTEQFRLESSGSQAYFTAANSIIMRPGGVTALTLDSSQNATFEGSYASLSKSLSGPIGFRVHNTSTGHYSVFRASTNSGYTDATSADFGIGGTTESGPFQNYGYVYTGTSVNGFRLFTNGSNIALTVDNSKNATFEGTISQTQAAAGSTANLKLNESGVRDWGFYATGGKMSIRPSSAGTWSFNGNTDVELLRTTASTTTGSGALQVSGGVGVAGAVNVGTYYGMVDGVTAPAATSGYAKIYVDTADGDLKVIFGDGTIKTIATDT